MKHFGVSLVQMGGMKHFTVFLGIGGMKHFQKATARVRNILNFSHRGYETFHAWFWKTLQPGMQAKKWTPPKKLVLLWYCLKFCGDMVILLVISWLYAYIHDILIQGVSLIVTQKENEIAWNKSVFNSSFWVLNGGYAWTFWYLDWFRFLVNSSWIEVIWFLRFI